jgi:hypothetical protein
VSRAAPALLLLSWSLAASAAPCGRPDVDFTLPPNDATAVPPNAILSAHYGSPALYDDEQVELVDGNGDEVAVQLMWDEADSMLRATPLQPLAPGFHELSWPGLRGLSGAGVGRGRSTSFFVQPEPDAAPPFFQGLTGIDWDLSRDRDPCLDRLEDRFVFELKLGETLDDAATELLAVQVFETRDPGHEDAEPARVALRAMPSGGNLEVRRPAKKAGKTCFAAIVQDLLGNVSGGGEREVCVETQKPPFFEGCSVAFCAGSPAAHSGCWLALALALHTFRRGARAKRPATARA